MRVRSFAPFLLMTLLLATGYGHAQAPVTAAPDAWMTDQVKQTFNAEEIELLRSLIDEVRQTVIDGVLADPTAKQVWMDTLKPRKIPVGDEWLTDTVKRIFSAEDIALLKTLPGIDRQQYIDAAIADPTYVSTLMAAARGGPRIAFQDIVRLIALEKEKAHEFDVCFEGGNFQYYFSMDHMMVLTADETDLILRALARRTPLQEQQALVLSRVTNSQLLQFQVGIIQSAGATVLSHNTNGAQRQPHGEIDDPQAMTRLVQGFIHNYQRQPLTREDFTRHEAYWVVLLKWRSLQTWRVIPRPAELDTLTDLAIGGTASRAWKLLENPVSATLPEAMGILQEVAAIGPTREYPSALAAWLKQVGATQRVDALNLLINCLSVYILTDEPGAVTVDANDLAGRYPALPVIRDCYREQALPALYAEGMTTDNLYRRIGCALAIRQISSPDALALARRVYLLSGPTASQRAKDFAVLLEGDPLPIPPTPATAP